MIRSYTLTTHPSVSVAPSYHNQLAGSAPILEGGSSDGAAESQGRLTGAELSTVVAAAVLIAAACMSVLAVQYYRSRTGRFPWEHPIRPDVAEVCQFRGIAAGNARRGAPRNSCPSRHSNRHFYLFTFLETRSCHGTQRATWTPLRR